MTCAPRTLLQLPLQPFAFPRELHILLLQHQISRVGLRVLDLEGIALGIENLILFADSRDCGGFLEGVELPQFELAFKAGELLLAILGFG